MSTITKQWLQQTIAEMEEHRDLFPGDLDDNHANVLASLRIALASLEAEAVAFRSKLKSPSAIGSEHWDYTDHRHPDAFELENCVIERLFTAPPAPVTINAEPVAWLWSHRKHPSEVSLVRPEDDERAEGAHWSGWSCQALYAAQPASAAMKDHQIRELVNELRDIAVEYHGTQQLRERIARTIRAAMLQGAEPVSDRDELPDGWVACSERMPKKGQEVLCTDQFENYETALYDTGYIPGPPFFATTAGEFHPTHWMPLPTPPAK